MQKIHIEGASPRQIGLASILRSKFKNGTNERNILNAIVHSSDITTDNHQIKDNLFSDENYNFDKNIQDILIFINDMLSPKQRINLNRFYEIETIPKSYNFTKPVEPIKYRKCKSCKKKKKSNKPSKSTSLKKSTSKKKK